MALDNSKDSLIENNYFINNESHMSAVALRISFSNNITIQNNTYT